MFDNINTRFMSFLISVLDKRSEKGATATEYSLLVGLIALAIVIGVGAFGTALDTWFSDLGTTVSGWVTP